MLTIASAALLCYGAFVSYRKGEVTIALFCLVTAGLVLRVFTAADLFLHQWDERYHALVAKNLLSNFATPLLYPNALLPYNPADWSSNHVWLHKQPLPLYSMALSMKIFGVHEWALRLPAVLLSTGAISLTYFIGSRLFSAQVGLLAAFFCAINGLIIELTGGRVATDHVDVFFMFFVELAVAFAVANKVKPGIKWLILSGVATGLAVLCKWLPAYVVLPVWLVLNVGYTEWKKAALQTAVFLVVSAAVWLPWQWWMAGRFPTEYFNEMAHNYRHLTEVLDGQRGGVLYFFEKLFITLNEFIWVALVWFIWGGAKGQYKATTAALVIWLVVPFLFFTVVKTKMQAYLLFTYPAGFVMLATWAVFLLGEEAKKPIFYIKRLALAVMVFLGARYCIERVKPLQDQTEQLQWANTLRKIGVEGDTKHTVYFNVQHNIEGMFYTDAIMYNYLPTPQQQQDLVSKGYKVVVNQHPDL